MSRTLSTLHQDRAICFGSSQVIAPIMLVTFSNWLSSDFSATDDPTTLVGLIH
jgi:hypothetical protein